MSWSSDWPLVPVICTTVPDERITPSLTKSVANPPLASTAPKDAPRFSMRPVGPLYRLSGLNESKVVRDWLVISPRLSSDPTNPALVKNTALRSSVHVTPNDSRRMMQPLEPGERTFAEEIVAPASLMIDPPPIVTPDAPPPILPPPMTLPEASRTDRLITVASPSRVFTPPKAPKIVPLLSMSGLATSAVIEPSP